VVAHFVIPATQKAQVGGLQSEANPGQKSKILTKKPTKAKRTRGVAYVVEHLPSKHKGPELKPQYGKKRPKARIQKQCCIGVSG
jgi:hypothetical protein